MFPVRNERIIAASLIVDRRRWRMTGNPEVWSRNRTLPTCEAKALKFPTIRQPAFSRNRASVGMDSICWPRMRTIFVFIATLTVGLAAAQTPPHHPEVPLQVSLCDIKAHPDMFLHKLVEFTATASHGFEDSMVEDNHCPWSEGRPGVWMEYGGKRSTATMYCCGISPKPDRSETLVVDGISLYLLDDNFFRAFDRRLHQKPSKPESSNTVRATLRGRIFARYEGIGGSQQKPEWRGYGNMGCCMLFVVAQVVSIDSAQR